MNPKLLLGLALVLSGGLFGCSKADHSTSEVAAPPSPRFPKTLKSKWTLQTNAIVEIPISPSDLKLKKAIYKAQYLPTNSMDIAVVAFRNPHSGRVWVGHEMEFYTETDSKIVGGFLKSGVVRWCDGLVSKQNDLESAIGVFDKEVDGSALARSCTGHDSDLRNVLRRRFITKGSDLDSETIQSKVKSVATKNEQVQIDMENPVTHSTASVWIETKTWKPIKAIEDGQQIFPKP